MEKKKSIVSVSAETNTSGRPDRTYKSIHRKKGRDRGIGRNIEKDISILLNSEWGKETGTSSRTYRRRGRGNRQTCRQRLHRNVLLLHL